MATKKKKKMKIKKTARGKVSATKKRAPKKTAKKTAKKAAVATKVVAKKKISKKKVSKKTTGAAKLVTSKAPNRDRQRSSPAFLRESSSARSGEQSGDMQGLSDVEGADSESVDELIEEGNAFEAGVVSGVEQAGEEEGSEVHTREVPEDDVPGEYLDND